MTTPNLHTLATFISVRAHTHPMRIKVHVIPNAKEARVVEVTSTNLEVKVDERAVDGRANRRLISILSEHFNVRKSKVSIIKGAKSRDKLVEIVLK